MNRKFLRWTLVGMVALVTLGAVAPGVMANLGLEISLVSPTSLAGAKTSAGWCRDRGVSVVVDFGQQSGKPIQVSCVVGPKLTGWDLLTAAELGPVGTAQYPTGFVCRLANFPPANTQDCSDTPTYSEGTWAYYFATAEAGNHWMFSGAGSQQRSPDCGTVEGWVFELNHTDGLADGPRIKPEAFRCR
ncbi:MAG: hypothetical protein ACKORF_06095 [Micrococcales bacterium]